jgi:regulator of protease activity HflC (stomatin/prohibitin superfamily)
MLSVVMVLVGAIVAVTILAAIPKVPGNALRGMVAVAALAVFLVFVCLSSFRYVGENELGVVIRNTGGGKLPPGRIIATDGENGPQAGILPPGFHAWLWPVIYEVEIHPVIRIEDGQVGLLTAADGRPLPPGDVFAPEWDDPDKMLDAQYFLTEGGGYRGPQTTVLTPGAYRFNPQLFTVERAPVTNIERATAGVVKSNVGQTPPRFDPDEPRLVDRGFKGIWREPLGEQKMYLNPKAFEVTHIALRRNVIQYSHVGAGDEHQIDVRTSDGFTFPVEVRVEYLIQAEDAPKVVAALGDDLERLQTVLTSAVRAIFRNNAERVEALDYVQQRSQQEVQSLAMLAEEMQKVGVTVTAVRIGDIGDEATLGPLLKTQTDRQIARQELLTFREQQKAAEQKRELTRAEQEAEEERRLATARYDVQIAEQDKERTIIAAGAEAEAIRITAEAQSEAYRVIAQQIGPSNAALIELLKVVGERGVQITPRVMVSGAANATGDAQTTALIGTMLDSMITRDERPTERAAGP